MSACNFLSKRPISFPRFDLRMLKGVIACAISNKTIWSRLSNKLNDNAKKRKKIIQYFFLEEIIAEKWEKKNAEGVKYSWTQYSSYVYINQTNWSIFPLLIIKMFLSDAVWKSHPHT